MIEYVDVVRPVRDPIGAGTKAGFTAEREGYRIERIDDGASFRVTHPDGRREVRIPITNVAAWGEQEPPHKQAPRQRRASPAHEEPSDG